MVRRVFSFLEAAGLTRRSQSTRPMRCLSGFLFAACYNNKMSDTLESQQGSYGPATEPIIKTFGAEEAPSVGSLLEVRCSRGTLATRTVRRECSPVVGRTTSEAVSCASPSSIVGRALASKPH